MRGGERKQVEICGEQAGGKGRKGRFGVSKEREIYQKVIIVSQKWYLGATSKKSIESKAESRGKTIAYVVSSL